MKPDYIVVGGGTSGCVVAGELVRTGHRVWLFEAGFNGTKLPGILRRPADYLRGFGSAYDWNLTTEKQPGLNQRRIRWPRGRGVGGCSLINAMIFYPPLESDWGAWERACGDSWSHKEMTVWHRFVEERCVSHVERLRYISLTTRAAMDAAADCLGEHSLNVHRVMCRDGIRATVKDIWQLELYQRSGMLRIFSDTQIVKLAIDQQSIVGVETNEGERIRSLRGVIVCAGAIGTPQLLMVSGIGESEVIKQSGGPCYAAISDVGENLQDHLVVPMIAQVDTRHRYPTHWTSQQRSQWQSLGRGPIASNLAEASGLLRRDRATNEPPECLWFTTPTHYLLHPQANAPAAMTIAVVGCHPLSRGSIRLQRTGGETRWSIDPCYLSNDRDLAVLESGIQELRPLWQHPQLCRLGAREVLPGADRRESSELTRYIARYAQTLYHPVGTCRMGRDAHSVVDGQGAVRQVSNLWIVDASIFPAIPAVNPHFMVLAVASKLAHEIIGKAS